MSVRENNRKRARPDSMPKSKLSGIKLGIIACAHGNGKASGRLRMAYEKHGVDVIAVCGDLGDDFKEITAVLKAVSPARVPVIAFPGSHEPEVEYTHALKKHKRIVDGVKKRRITIKGYDLILLPGSGVNVSHANYRIAASKKLLKEYRDHGYRVFLISQLNRFIRKPDTVLLCHDPPRCYNAQGIDVAYSGIVRKNFTLKTVHAKILGIRNPLALIHLKGQIVPQPVAATLAKLKYPVSVKHRNVGIPDLRSFLRKKRILFFACGHIHEAGQRAITAAGKPVRPGKWSSSVWYNAAAAVKGKGGILIIDGKRAKFKNITV